MSWDYEHIITLSERHSPYEMVSSTLPVLAKYGNFLGLTRLEVHLNSFGYDVVRDGYADDQSQSVVNKSWQPPMSLEDQTQIEQLITLFRDERYAIDLILGNHRWYSGGVETESSTYAIAPYSTWLRFFGRKFDGYRRRERFMTGIYYRAGDSRIYKPSLQGDYAMYNLQMLQKEISTIAHMGAVSIIGADADTTDNPRYWSSVYYANPLAFWGDLQGITSDTVIQIPQSVEEAADWLQQAAHAASNITVEPMVQGFLIQSQLGTEGNLSKFYDALRLVSQS